MRDVAYVKLFSSILDSTVWETDPATRVVWIALMAMADRDGEVSASVPGLARRAGVSRVECERALAVFLAPDPDSRTKNHDGRRIVEIDGGWRLLNYEKYRDMATVEEAKAKAAARQKRYRERIKAKQARDGSDVTNDAGDIRTRLSRDVTDSEAQAEAPSKAQAKAKAVARARKPHWAHVVEVFTDAHSYVAPLTIDPSSVERHCRRILAACGNDLDVVRRACESHAADPWVQEKLAGIPHMAGELHKHVGSRTGLATVNDFAAETADPFEVNRG